MEIAVFNDSYPPAQDGVLAVTEGLVRAVPVTVPGALATALGEILDAAEVRRKPWAHAAEIVRQTASLERMARRFISLYRLVGERRQSRDVGIPA
ncbi:MAG TPA: hypothetical protein VGG32_09040 [Thermoplasmata archaeon]|jgi:glycosyltransferase involved in cell wall biosynthesis